MASIRELGRKAWRKWRLDGVTSSGPNMPDTVDIFPFVDAVHDIIEEVKGQVAGQRLARPLVSSLAAELGRPAETVIEVYGDTEENNGVYRKVGAPGTGSYVKDGPLPQLNVSNLTARIDQRLLPLRELVVEGTKLLIPSMYYWMKGNPQIASPLDGSLYWEVDIQTAAAQVRWYYWSNSLAAGGGNPIVVVEEGNNPQVSSAGLVLIGHSINGQVTTDLPIVGGVAGGVARNQWLEGKFPEAVEWLYANAQIKSASPAMQALGFKKVFADANAADIFAGLALDELTAGGEPLFHRICIYQPVPAAMTPAANLFMGDIFKQTLVLKKEKQINANVSLWQLRDRVNPGIVADRINFGVDQGSARNWEVAGGQFAIGKGYIGWIARDDFPPLSPVSYRPVLGPSLWMLSGREFTIYPQNLIGFRKDKEDTVLAGFRSVNPDAQGDLHSRKGSVELVIDPDKCGPKGTFEVRILGGRKDIRYAVPTNNFVATPFEEVVDLTLLGLGDSMHNRGLEVDVDPILRAYNINPTWLGTMLGALDDSDPYNDIRGLPGEAREGFEAADYTGRYTDKANSVANWPAYMAASKLSKRQSMPFYRDAEPGDDPAKVINGKKVDIRNYLTKTGQGDPQIIFIGLMTNDEALRPVETAANNVAELIKIYGEDARAALPNVRVTWWAPPQSQTNLAYKHGDHYQIIQAAEEAIRDLDDPYFEPLPIWASTCADFGYKLDPAAQVDVNYAIRARIADGTHWPNGDFSPLRKQAAKVLAAYIICKAKEILS
jgi:hypothetical protein